MLGAISTLPVVLALLSLATAGAAIVWLSKMNKHVSDLGLRILESADIDKIIKASDKTITFESRMTACEEKADRSQELLAEHDKRLNELTSNGAAVAQVVDRHSADFAAAAEESTSFITRFEGFESSVNEKLDQLPEHGTKIDELAGKLASVEEKASSNGADLAENKRSIEAIRDEIRSLEEFQTATEKTRSLILAALNDMQTSKPSEDKPEIVPEAAEPEETSEEPDYSLITAPEAPQSEENSEGAEEEQAESQAPQFEDTPEGAEEGQAESEKQHSFGRWN